MPRSIAILTSGTRGDVQPFVALALGLQGAGYHPRLVTHPQFASLAAAYGVPFAPLDGDTHELLQHHEARDALIYNGRPLRTLLATMRYLREARPLFERTLYSAFEQCRDADALIVTLPTTWGAQIAEALDVPCAFALLQPLGETAAFPSPFLPAFDILGPAYNRLSHRLSQRALWQPWRATLNRWRRDCLGLPPLSRVDPFTHLPTQHALWLYGISPHVVARPPDWPSQRQLVGYWTLSSPSTWKPDPELLHFLAAGPPPVYVGFGSTGASDAETLQTVFAAVERTGVRALFAGASAHLLRLPPHSFACADVPHDWLFPRVAAVVHHGGAGTTAAGLRAGVPTVVVPRGIDQFFWARRIQALGCGPPGIPQRKLSVEHLAAAITTAVSDPAMRARSEALAEQLRTEDGVARAVELLAERM